MELLLLVLSVGFPLFKIVLFPARAIGRGGNWTWIGAGMIVALMMALFFGVQQMTAVPDRGTTPAGATDQQLPDLDSLAKLL